MIRKWNDGSRPKSASISTTSTSRSQDRMVSNVPTKTSLLRPQSAKFLQLIKHQHSNEQKRNRSSSDEISSSLLNYTPSKVNMLNAEEPVMDSGYDLTSNLGYAPLEEVWNDASRLKSAPTSTTSTLRSQERMLSNVPTKTSLLRPQSAKFLQLIKHQHSNEQKRNRSSSDEISSSLLNYTSSKVNMLNAEEPVMDSGYDLTSNLSYAPLEEVWNDASRPKSAPTSTTSTLRSRDRMLSNVPPKTSLLRPQSAKVVQLIKNQNLIKEAQMTSRKTKSCYQSKEQQEMRNDSSFDNTDSVSTHWDTESVIYEQQIVRTVLESRLGKGYLQTLRENRVTATPISQEWQEISDSDYESDLNDSHKEESNVIEGDRSNDGNCAFSIDILKERIDKAKIATCKQMLCTESDITRDESEYSCSELQETNVYSSFNDLYEEKSNIQASHSTTESKSTRETDVQDSTTDLGLQSVLRDIIKKSSKAASTVREQNGDETRDIQSCILELSEMNEYGRETTNTAKIATCKETLCTESDITRDESEYACSELQEASVYSSFNDLYEEKSNIQASHRTTESKSTREMSTGKVKIATCTGRDITPESASMCLKTTTSERFYPRPLLISNSLPTFDFNIGDKYGSPLDDETVASNIDDKYRSPLDEEEPLSLESADVANMDTLYRGRFCSISKSESSPPEPRSSVFHDIHEVETSQGRQGSQIESQNEIQMMLEEDQNYHPGFQTSPRPKTARSISARSQVQWFKTHIAHDEKKKKNKQPSLSFESSICKFVQVDASSFQEFRDPPEENDPPVKTHAEANNGMQSLLGPIQSLFNLSQTQSITPYRLSKSKINECREEGDIEHLAVNSRGVSYHKVRPPIKIMNTVREVSVGSTVTYPEELGQNHSRKDLPQTAIVQEHDPEDDSDSCSSTVQSSTISALKAKNSDMKKHLVSMMELLERSDVTFPHCNSVELPLKKQKSIKKRRSSGNAKHTTVSQAE